MSGSFFIATANLELADGVNELAPGTSQDSGYEVTSNQLTFGSADTAGTITFSNGAGVFEGRTNESWAPESDGNGYGGVTTDYYAAVAQYAGNSDVTFTFQQPQEFFGILWGSLSSNNNLDFYNGNTLVYSISYGDMIDAVDASGTPTVGQGTYYVGVNIPGGYTSVVANQGDHSGGFEFASITYAPYQVSDPTVLSSGIPAIPLQVDDNGNPLCFLEGTMIATPAGERAVETLKAGDLVLTAAGQAEPVRWMGVRKMSARFADKLRGFPVRVRAGALAEGIPTRDLLVSPDHALYVGGVLAHASALVNGLSVIREQTMPAAFTYYHVELSSHALILAEGAAAETFIDNASRMHFDNWDSHPGGAPLEEMDLPRAKAARQLPASLRARHNARAAQLSGIAAAA